jgi:hypothetical protein
MYHATEHTSEAFGEWLAAIQAGQASFKDNTFTHWNDDKSGFPGYSTAWRNVTMAWRTCSLGL